LGEPIEETKGALGVKENRASKKWAEATGKRVGDEGEGRARRVTCLCARNLNRITGVAEQNIRLGEGT